MKRKYAVLTFALISILTLSFIIFSAGAQSVLSRYGSRGEEVRQIQTRLKQWGYYNGAVDGIYGWMTTEAVKFFQRKHGLVPDGIAGPATLGKIGLPTGAASSGSSTSEANVNLLARVINGEARGEPYTGQVAVGAVIMNRIRHPSFPNTLAGVIYQPGAFTAIVDGQIHAVMQESSVRAARDAINGWDPTGGAIYYYNPRTATNQWIRSRPIVTTIGKHVFCK